MSYVSNAKNSHYYRYSVQDPTGDALNVLTIVEYPDGSLECISRVYFRTVEGVESMRHKRHALKEDLLAPLLTREFNWGAKEDSWENICTLLENLRISI